MLYRKLFLLFLLLLTIGIPFYYARPRPTGPLQTLPLATNTTATPLKGFVIPFTPLAGHGVPVVRVRLNDRVEANFILDTGSTITCMTERVAEKLGLPTHRQEVSINDSPETRDADVVSVGRLSAGEWSTQCDILVLEDNSPLTALDPERKMDGILGMDVLNRFALVFDFEQNQIFLLKDGNLTDEQLVLLGMKGGTSAAIPVTSDNEENTRFLVPAYVGQSGRYSFLMDTGAPNTIALDPGKKIPLGMRSKNAGAATLTGTWKYKILPVASFGAGDTAEAAKPFRLAPFVCGVSRDAHIQPLLGLNYWSYFRVVLDCPAHCLYLSPLSNPQNLPYPTESSRQSAEEELGDDLVVRPSASGVWSVTSTLEDGVFGAAGVREGDVLEKINDKTLGKRWITDTMPDSLQLGDTIRLQLRRNGKVITIEVP